MCLDTQFTEILRQVFQNDPALVQELKVAEDGVQAVGKIAAAAEQQGGSLDDAQRALLSSELCRQVQLLKALRELIARDEGLDRALRDAQDPEAIRKAIEAAADRHGMPIEAAAIASHLQLPPRPSASQELSDEQLDEVVGGTEVTMVGTAGLGVTSLLGTCTVLKWSLQPTYVDINRFTTPQ